MLEAYVEKHYTNFTLQVEYKDEGHIAIVGRNGSGKTTFLKIIAGITKPDKGYVKLDDKDITNLPINKRNIILVTPESYIPNFRVKKHLIWGIQLRKIKYDEKEVYEIAKNFEIPIEENKKVGQLSLGNKEKVALVSALLSRPRMILIDEAFSNINNRQKFITNYLELAKDFKIDVIYVTQDLQDAKLSEKIYKMDDGRLTLYTP